jgi:integrase
VVELIEAIYASGRQALAVRLKATVSKIFAFAISKDLLDTNPAAGIGRIADLRPRERILSDNEIRLAWHAFAAAPVSTNVGLALRLVLATGQRPGEVTGLRWSEIIDLADPQKAIWTLPRERAKNGREHTIPLSPLAVSIISQVQGLPREEGGSDYLFKSPRAPEAISPHALAVAMARIAQRLGQKSFEGAETWVRDRPTPHDLRRTAATRMRALGVPSEDVKHVLNHTQTSVLGRHYDRYDPLREKRRALESWASELERILGAKSGYLLFWETGIDANTKHIAGRDHQQVPSLAIVDGQQRLTSPLRRHEGQRGRSRKLQTGADSDRF